MNKNTKVLEIKTAGQVSHTFICNKKAPRKGDAFLKRLTVYAVSTALFFSWILALLPLRSRW